jgi:hypothetical protein
MLTLIDYQALDLEFLQMVASGVQGDPEPGGQLFGGQVLSSFQLHEHGSPLAFLAERGGVLLEEREAGTHVTES